MPFEKFGVSKSPEIPPAEEGKEKIEEGIKKKPEEVKKEVPPEIPPPEKPPGEEIEKVRAEIEAAQERVSREKEEAEKKEEGVKRLELIRESVDVPKEYKTLVGDNSEEAWQERKELESERRRKDLRILARSLAGVRSERSREWLNENKEKQPLWASVAEGLKGDDSPKAHQIREYLYFDEREGRVRGKRAERIVRATIGTLLGPQSERYYNFMKWVDGWWPLGWYTPGNLAESLRGCTSEKSIEWRRKLKGDAPAETLISLAGIDEPWANEMREELGKDPRLNWAYQKSSRGIESEEGEE
jgi:hypothetical protein